MYTMIICDIRALQCMGLVCQFVWYVNPNAPKCTWGHNSLLLDAIDRTAWVDSAPNQTHWESGQNSADCQLSLVQPVLLYFSINSVTSVHYCDPWMPKLSQELSVTPMERSSLLHSMTWRPLNHPTPRPPPLGVDSLARISWYLLSLSSFTCTIISVCPLFLVPGRKTWVNNIRDLQYSFGTWVAVDCFICGTWALCIWTG